MWPRFQCDKYITMKIQAVRDILNKKKSVTEVAEDFNVFLWLTVLIFSPELFIHSSLLLLISFFCGWFLYIRFHVSQVFFTYILTNYFFLLIFLFHFSVSGAWIYFFFAFSSFVLVFFIPQFFPFVLRVQEQLFLVIMSLVLFFWWFLFSAIFLTGFSLFGVASTLPDTWWKTINYPPWLERLRAPSIVGTGPPLRRACRRHRRQQSGESRRGRRHQSSRQWHRHPDLATR